MVKISTNTLLKLYLIIPFCLLIVILDTFFFAGFLKRTLKPDPESYRLITVFFFYPHVFMSIGTLLDGEYLKIYKENLLSPKSLFYFGTLLIGLCWNQEIFFILFAYISSKHLIGQQMGLEKLWADENDPVIRSNFSYWAYVLITSILYYRVGFSQSIFWEILSQFDLRIHIRFLITLFIFIILFFDARGNSIKAKDIKLKILFWGNYFLIISVVFVFQSGYFFFALFIPRFIHDITAIIFYTCHDRNRNSLSNHNFIGQIFQKISKKSYIFLLPIIYLCLANILVQMNSKMGNLFLLFLGTIHFFVESFMWKKGTMHRINVAFNE